MFRSERRIRELGKGICSRGPEIMPEPKRVSNLVHRHLDEPRLNILLGHRVSLTDNAIKLQLRTENANGLTRLRGSCQAARPWMRIVAMAVPMGLRRDIVVRMWNNLVPCRVYLALRLAQSALKPAGPSSILGSMLSYRVQAVADVPVSAGYHIGNTRPSRFSFKSRDPCIDPRVSKHDISIQNLASARIISVWPNCVDAVHRDGPRDGRIAHVGGGVVFRPVRFPRQDRPDGVAPASLFECREPRFNSAAHGCAPSLRDRGVNIEGDGLMGHDQSFSSDFLGNVDRWISRL
eukprot:scaffold3641_cov32-Tisochrysis_lutea.AAC.2